jgi:hypothetical protein
MALRKVIAEAPAWKIYEGKEYYADGDLVAVPHKFRDEVIMKFFTLGSVIGSCIEDGDCPFEGLDRAKRLGHETHYAFPKASMITRDPQARFYAYYQPHDSIIRFHGKNFKICKASNDNIILREVETADVAA